MDVASSVRYFCSPSCEGISPEFPRETGEFFYGPLKYEDLGKDHLTGNEYNLSDERVETGCKEFGGGPCVNVTGVERIPKCWLWSCEQVGDWVESIGYPLYRDCFVSNFVNGRRLILIDASALPKMGITDFKHIRAITSEIRELLHVDDISCMRSICLPQREKIGMFLEQKSMTGRPSDKLTYEKFDSDWKYLKFQPPLCNQALILPHIVEVPGKCPLK